jgi:methionyl-tRNA synthetase
VKSGSDAEMFAAQLACSAAIEAFRVLTIFLRPILPDLAIRAAKFLSLDENQLTWEAAEVPLPEGHVIGRYEHLLTRVDAKQVESMIEASKETMANANPSPPNPPLEGEGSKAGTASARAPPPPPPPSRPSMASGALGLLPTG